MKSTLKPISIISLLIVSFSLPSCAISKAVYLGTDDYSQRFGSLFSGKINNAENINGSFPEAVYIKTRTQTFNLYHYYILVDGRIWYKSIDPKKEPIGWTLFMKTGIPNNRQTSAIAEISADADELSALSVEGNFYRYCFDRTIAHRSNVWLNKQGWPVKEQLYFDNRTAKNRAWALGKRNSHVLYYEDIFGNQHHNGTMEIATTYVLLEDGQEICFGDAGLPSDFSRNFIGPERGAFVATSLSVSASTMFVINEAGEMYTRLADFDTIGCDPMWFKYTYIPYKSDLPGTSYFSNLNEWALPSEEWRSQLRIPLSGKAAVTRHITILQNGHGNNARELRVAGYDEEGNTGYWSKAIFYDKWEFKTASLFFEEDSILVNAKTGAQGRRGLPFDKSYTGYWWNGNEIEYGWEYKIPNFNILEGDCDFHITWQGETCVLKLHPVEMWTYLKRDYLPGRTGSPKIFFATLEIPENAFKSLSNVFIRQLTEKFSKYDREYFHYTIAATNNYLILRDTAETSSLLFLTDGTVSGQYSELHIGRYIENYGEVQRYYSPDLAINNNTVLTVEELTEMITLNRQFADELKYQIRVLKWSQLTAFKISAVYLPIHYITKMTPLRFFDIPKIRTITSFGNKLVTANSAYINTVTDTRIRLYSKITEMLETRILCYADLLKEFSSYSTSVNGVILPQWYSDNIADYWGIAGFPLTISGAFSFSGRGNENAMMPAVLSFIPSLSEQNISGWFFAIGESSGFSIFIESRNFAKIIYSRKGKTPQEQKLQLDCILHINENANNRTERYIIERCLQPFIMAGEKTINVRIIFDGKNFEIRENPVKRGSSIIFRGIL
jgi:hypothetical protein